METTSTLQLGTMMMSLFGGLALFLFGMDQMTDALKIITGTGLKQLLARVTSNRFSAAVTGAALTAIIQSSSVTTVLVVGFISAGLLSLSQSIGIILGANVGTTITAQIIAFKISQYGLVLIAIGFMLLFFNQSGRFKQYGTMLMGLGLIFFGMDLMGDGMRPLRSYEPFIALLQQMSNPFMAVLLSAVFTALVQSSSATTGVIIVLASQGFVTLETGIALAFGANIGTSITAILASIGKPREAVQAAIIHVLFNVIGVLIWFAFIGQLAELVRLISPTVPELVGQAKLAAETPRQIANAHTLFNVANMLLFIWFTRPLAWLAQHLVPERETVPGRIKPKYLDELLLETPDLALDRVRLELGRLGECVLKMVRRSLPTVTQGSRWELTTLSELDDDVDALQGAIVTYLGRLSQENILHEQSQKLYNYMAAANYLENIGDTIETNMVDIGLQRLGHQANISRETRQVLKTLHERVLWSVERCLVSLVDNDKAIAEEVIAAKPEINLLADTADAHLSQRLTVKEADRLALFRLETDSIEYLKRIYYFAKRIAKVVAEVDPQPQHQDADAVEA